MLQGSGGSTRRSRVDADRRTEGATMPPRSNAKATSWGAASRHPLTRPVARAGPASGAPEINQKIGGPIVVETR
jgi:hypothetical protein